MLCMCNGEIIAAHLDKHDTFAQLQAHGKSLQGLRPTERVTRKRRQREHKDYSTHTSVVYARRICQLLLNLYFAQEAG